MSRLVTVHSDGTGHGTVILDENGAQLANVAELNFSVEANGVARGNIEVLGIKTNVSNVAIEEVTFVCPLCQDRSEHTCDQQLGGGAPWPGLPSIQFAPNGMASLPPIGARGGQVLPAQGMQVNRILDYEICGRTDSTGKFECYINKDIAHTQHFDAKNAASF